MLSLTLKGLFLKSGKVLALAFLLFFPGRRRGGCVSLATAVVLVRFALCESRIYEVFDRVFIDTLRPPKMRNGWKPCGPWLAGLFSVTFL